VLIATLIFVLVFLFAPNRGIPALDCGTEVIQPE